MKYKISGKFLDTFGRVSMIYAALSNLARLDSWGDVFNLVSAFSEEIALIFNKIGFLVNLFLVPWDYAIGLFFFIIPIDIPMQWWDPVALAALTIQFFIYLAFIRYTSSSALKVSGILKALEEFIVQNREYKKFPEEKKIKINESIVLFIKKFNPLSGHFAIIMGPSFDYFRAILNDMPDPWLEKRRVSSFEFLNLVIVFFTPHEAIERSRLLLDLKRIKLYLYFSVFVFLMIIIDFFYRGEISGIIDIIWKAMVVYALFFIMLIVLFLSFFLVFFIFISFLKFQIKLRKDRIAKKIINYFINFANRRSYQIGREIWNTHGTALRKIHTLSPNFGTVISLGVRGVTLGFSHTKDVSYTMIDYFKYDIRSCRLSLISKIGSEYIFIDNVSEDLEYNLKQAEDIGLLFSPEGVFLDDFSFNLKKIL